MVEEAKPLVVGLPPGFFQQKQCITLASHLRLHIIYVYITLQWLDTVHNAPFNAIFYKNDIHT